MSYESLLASVLEQSTPLVLAALAAMITNEHGFIIHNASMGQSVIDLGGCWYLNS